MATTRPSMAGRSRRSTPAGRILAMGLAVLAVACATGTSPPPAPVRSSVETTDLRWHFVRCRMGWPPDTEPRLFVDTLLAQEVMAPVLNRYGDAIALWRFHRRARRDAAGHQFSFIYYAAPGAAGTIVDAVNGSPALARLRRAGVVTAVLTGPWGGPGGGRALSATSDAEWSEAMQRAWPHYIEGVSRLWLALIGEARAAAGAIPAGDVDAWLAQYRDIDAALTDTWQREGRHALLHHLNAIFGYAPIPVVERRMMRF